MNILAKDIRNAHTQMVAFLQREDDRGASSRRAYETIASTSEEYD